MNIATRDIDIALLRAFLAVVETGSVTKAASRLNQTQAAISQKIKRLEDLFQLDLFDRVNRSIKPTVHGERLISHAEKMISINDETWSKMTSPEFEGEILLGVPHDIVLPFMPPILKTFYQAWPCMNVVLVSGNTTDLLRQLDFGLIDLTLTTEPFMSEDAILLLEDRLVWMGAKNGSAYKRDPLSVAIGGPDCIFRETAVKALSDMGKDWRVVNESDHPALIHATLEADLAIAPVMASTISKGLAELPQSSGFSDMATYYIGLHLSKSAKNQAVMELSEHICAYFDTMVDKVTVDDKLKMMKFDQIKSQRRKPGSVMAAE